MRFSSFRSSGLDSRGRFRARLFISAAFKYLSRKFHGKEEIDRYPLRFDFDQKDLEANQAVLARWRKERPRHISSINWFMPDYGHAFGGIYTILRFAEFFTKKGIANRLVIFDGRVHSDVDSIKRDVCSEFPYLKSVEVYVDPKIEKIPYSDVSIATLWTTAYSLLKFNNTRGKCYFIQDYEPLFYPAGALYGLAESTYRFGFSGITNGPELMKIYKDKYGAEAEFFVPSVNTKLFKPAEDTPRPTIKRVFFYARPTRPRNGFEVGMLALEKIKNKYPDVEVVTAGSDLKNYDFPFEVTNLGLLTLKQTAELYRSCDIGLSFMFTCHPSYIPLELMASGCLATSNRNPANSWILKDRYNCLLFEPTPSSILETFELAVKDYHLRRAIYDNALETVKSTSWENEMEKIYRFITRT